MEKLSAISVKDKVEQFKRELRSYRYYEKSIDEIDGKLEELRTQRIGVSSPKPKEVIAGKASVQYCAPKDSMMLEIMEKEQHLMASRNYYISRIQMINDALSKLDTSDADILRELYIKRVPFDVVADEHHYSAAHFKRYANKLIKSVV